jgi:hypothetical protein
MPNLAECQIERDTVKFFDAFALRKMQNWEMFHCDLRTLDAGACVWRSIQGLPFTKAGPSRGRGIGDRALLPDGGQSRGENLFGIGADAEIGVGLGMGDAARGGDDIGSRKDQAP